jgi:UDP-N-acetylmuramoyl-L-alanyl-D-glutamate--2,6-diaminopimelate ligase
MRRLAELMGSETPVGGSIADVGVRGLTADSRTVEPGFVFAALPGARADGARYVAQAAERGAVAILAGANAEIDVAAGVLVLRVAEPRRTLALMAARFYPRQPKTIVAITGTSGKTSVAEFVRQIFTACGRHAASLGTIGVVEPGGAVYGSLTTPDPVALHRTLDELAGRGVTHLALEASSHGLDQHRLDGVRLTAAAFNNLGHDHLDYHPTTAAYLEAKLRLFRELMRDGQPAVINADGARASDAIAVAEARGLTVSTTGVDGRTLRLVSARRLGFKQHLEVAHGGATYDVELPLIGDYQAGNALVAAALAVASGEAPDRAIGALTGLQGVKGRLEVVAQVAGGIAVVDYAHKPEALAAALDALRPFATGRLICIFGCGGDRDRAKRPVMGRIAVEKADIVIITDDNPRSEVAASIRAEISAAAAGAREIGDRAEAIRAGIGMMRPGDVLIVAGKGHETGQIVGDKVLPFSDHEEIGNAIRARQ